MKVLAIGAVLSITLATLLYSAVVLPCNCPFKDPTACKWWCSIL